MGAPHPSAAHQVKQFPLHDGFHDVENPFFDFSAKLIQLFIAEIHHGKGLGVLSKVFLRIVSVVQGIGHMKDVGQEVFT